MEILTPIFIFAGKAFLVLLCLVVLLLVIAGMAARAKHKPSLEIEILNDHIADQARSISEITLEKDQLKSFIKEQKELKKKPAMKPRLFVLQFDGDIRASATEQLREEISACLSIASPEDQFFLKLESPGGMVHGYGLAAAQLMRIRSSGQRLTVAVDKVAASGGYMMACVAHHIISAPFAVLGSIGVVAQVPNLHRLLKKYDVDYKEYTAGEYKRTVSFLGEITPKGEQKFLQDMEETHHLFKDHVKELRPQLDINQIATGEHWYGKKALSLGLADEIMTSDEFLSKAAKDFKLVQVKIPKKKAFQDKITDILSRLLLGL